MTMLSPVAMLGWIGAVLLFLLALRTWSDGRAARRRARMGLAGMMLAMGAALYTHDVVSLPEMLSMAALGSGIGYLIARRASMRSAWPILALLQAMIGAALLLTAFAIDGNAIAFAVLFGRLFDDLARARRLRGKLHCEARRQAAKAELQPRRA